jgi:SAM-dependent methyltransferase
LKLPSDYVASNTAYYDAHADEFCQNTAGVDMSELYVPFLREVPAGGRILDAGSGSGRDSAFFLRKGYRVLAIDASNEMVAATSKLSGQPALRMRFDEVAFDAEFDGIWACASLLHVARQDLPTTMERMARALKPGGVFYLSFKHGDRERVESGRFFTNMDEVSFGKLLATQPELEPLRVWIADDFRDDGRSRLRWFNAIVRRRSGDRADANEGRERVL